LNELTHAWARQALRAFLLRCAACIEWQEPEAAGRLREWL
jgi:hypothetical protein